MMNTTTTANEVVNTSQVRRLNTSYSCKAILNNQKFKVKPTSGQVSDDEG
jgi:hypothetical protein